jgi:DnaJ-class molecular chaperone
MRADLGNLKVRDSGTCHHCGGSGMLRLDDQRYRTCLDCLGQGQVLRPAAGTLFVPRISVAVSASGAG